MRFVGPLVLAVSLGLASAGAAEAADMVTYPAPKTDQVIPLDQGPTYDWDGFYAGVYTGGQKGAPGWQYSYGLLAGVNKQISYYLIGGEVGVHGLVGSGSSGTYGQVLTRGGVLLTDNLVGYGALGYGLDIGGGSDQNLLVGGGLEMAVAQDVSLRAQYLYGVPLTSSSSPVNEATIGIDFHF